MSKSEISIVLVVVALLAGGGYYWMQKKARMKEQPVSLSGHYEGKEDGMLNGVPFTTNFTIEVQQVGDKMHAVFDDGKGNVLKFDATVHGRRVEPFTSTSAESSTCGAGQFANTAEIAGDRISGTSKGLTKKCGEISAKFFARKVTSKSLPH
jgi:hypothetical protein